MQVLDHGFCNLIETWGSDERVIESARMSTDGAFRGWERDCPDCTPQKPLPANRLCDLCRGSGKVEGDTKLLRYLWNHKHLTPFEMCGATFEIKAPIFVFREWHRHRTQSYNEMSARYIPIPDESYVPSISRLLAPGGNNKQAGTMGATLDENEAWRFVGRLKGLYEAIQDVYQDALEAGVPKELARLVIPVGRYSKMRASANLRNWLAFLTLRSAPDAQWEIAEFARAVQTELGRSFPRTLSLFEES